MSIKKSDFEAYLKSISLKSSLTAAKALGDALDQMGNSFTEEELINKVAINSPSNAGAVARIVLGFEQYKKPPVTVNTTTTQNNSNKTTKSPAAPLQAAPIRGDVVSRKI